jgi:hypothetical protein
MIKPAGNPWQQMPKDAARRVDIETSYNFFWITDSKGRYGLLITFGFLLGDIEIEDKVKGISIVKSSDGSSGKLYFVLNNNKDWEIFLSVCTDLVFMSSSSADETGMIPVINKRIVRWQKFLSENSSVSMPEILQMGLLTELYCLLYNVIPSVGCKEAIICWVGPDADKKDFSLAEFFIEVKSFISSKGPIVKISSLHQLEFELKPLYLIAYGLSKVNSGYTIIDLIASVKEYIPEDDRETIELFETKLASYGYAADITEAPFYSFKVDAERCYLVSQEFPKILAGSIDSRISAVQYSIDLARCISFEAKPPFNNN